MFKKSMFCVALASLVLATSCSQDDLQTAKFSQNPINLNAGLGGQPISTFAAAKGKAVKSRAVETTITNLGSFTMNAFQDGETNYMNNVEYTTSDNGSSWTTAAGKFFWPVEGDLHLYGYAPAAPGTSGTFKIDKDAQTLTDFVPFETAAAQQDFVYAKSTGNNATNGTTGVELNFQHALTEISVAAKNSNTAYTVKVTGVKLGNVKTKGTFTFPSIANSAASWTLSDVAEDVGSYETTWSTATELSSSVSTLDEANVAFMLLPQQLEKSEKASEKAYLALKVNITMQGGKVIRDGWAYIGLNTNWEMGKHYAYTLDFSDGAGQDENGKQIISGKEMVLKVKVTPWDAKAVDLPEKFITGTTTAAFTYTVGGENGTSYTVTPDASGNWSVPVSKFNGVTNMGYAFSNCGSLTSLDVSGFNTSNVTNMNSMFISCSSLTSLDVSHFNTSNVTDMYQLFSNCRSLKTLDLSGWNTENVTTLEYMFAFCISLTSLDLSHFDTSSVTGMGGMFWNCNKLTSLDVSGFNTSNVTNMNSMFSGCSSFTNLDLSGFNTSKVIRMDYMFSGCSKLKTLDLSHFDTSNVTNINYMFSGCSSLTTIRMVGCSSATVDKIKKQLASDGITSCTIVTE